jgi:RNA polymerase sigma-70 factor (ECF subfamily)
MRTVVERLRRAALLGPEIHLSDGQLLDAFLSRRDEAAFEALLRRHGPMVLAVCRRVLRHEQDAEDAFQATFLVLARKGAVIRPRDLVGNWLYGVAYRTAMKARAMNAKRRTKEREVSQIPRPEGRGDGAPEELLAALDRELHGLPDRYRAPVVLCELEGRPRKEAARLLGLAEGTLSWRLARARKLLARRLARFGPAAPAGVLALALPRAVPPALLASTARAGVSMGLGKSLAAGAVSARVMALMEGVTKAMLLSKLKLMPAVLLALVLSAGAINVTYRAVAADPGPASPEARAAQDDLEALRLEVEALRKELRATRERVKALETGMLTLHAATALGQSHDQRPGKSDEEADRRLIEFTKLMKAKLMKAAQTQSDPVADAQEALKKLRANPNDKQAAEALERASKQLRERGKPQAPPGK